MLAADAQATPHNATRTSSSKHQAASSTQLDVIGATSPDNSHVTSPSHLSVCAPKAGRAGPDRDRARLVDAKDAMLRLAGEMARSAEFVRPPET